MKPWGPWRQGWGTVQDNFRLSRQFAATDCCKLSSQLKTVADHCKRILFPDSRLNKIKTIYWKIWKALYSRGCLFCFLVGRSFVAVAIVLILLWHLKMIRLSKLWWMMNDILRRHFDEKFWWFILIRHFVEIFWWYILMRRFDKTFWWAILMRHFNNTFW